MGIPQDAELDALFDVWAGAMAANAKIRAEIDVHEQAIASLRNRLVAIPGDVASKVYVRILQLAEAQPAEAVPESLIAAKEPT